jgi:hypothetical protein
MARLDDGFERADGEGALDGVDGVELRRDLRLRVALMLLGIRSGGSGAPEGRLANLALECPRSG